MNRFVVLLVIFCGVFLTFQTAQAGWVEFFFPSLRDTSDDPSQTLTAPFADGVGAEASSKEGVDNQGAERSIVNIVPLSQPHRTVGMVSNWVVEAVSNALSFQNDDFKVDMQKTQVYFDPGGWGEFQNFCKRIKFSMC